MTAKKYNNSNTDPNSCHPRTKSQSLFRRKAKRNLGRTPPVARKSNVDVLARYVAIPILTKIALNINNAAKFWASYIPKSGLLELGSGTRRVGGFWDALLSTLVDSD